MVPRLTGPLSRWSPNWHPRTTHSIGPPSHCPPPSDTNWSPPPTHWSPISLVPQCNPGYTVLIGPPSHWSPSLTPSTLFSLVPHRISPPMQPRFYSSHWSPISLVPQSNPVYPVLIGSPSHWSPNATLVIQFSLVPHLIGPPVQSFLPCYHWFPISLVPQCNPGYTALIGPPSHWSPNLTLAVQFSLVPHLSGPPMWLVTQFALGDWTTSHFIQWLNLQWKWGHAMRMRSFPWIRCECWHAMQMCVYARMWIHALAC